MKTQDHYTLFTGEAVQHIITHGCHVYRDRLRRKLARAFRVTRNQLGTNLGRRENRWFKRHCQFVSGWPNKW